MTEPETAAWRWLWGKSNAGGSPNLLLQHLLDAAAVAELIWDHYLAPAVRSQLDDCCAGRGRELFALLAGLHDVGKATPSFQSKSDALAARLRRRGLDWRPLSGKDRRWHHTLSGAVIVDRVLSTRGWPRRTIFWIVPLISGHHGVIPPAEEYRTVPPEGHGRAAGWRSAQEEIVDAVASELDLDLPAMAPTLEPPRAVQLALSGAVIMADWIASGVHFSGLDDPAQVGLPVARERARRAWDALRISGGWCDVPAPNSEDLIQHRFGKAARPVQDLAVREAWAMFAPGLLLVEAPMGEGKTELALAASEVLAHRFGADGVYIGMPTQATSDALYNRSIEWASKVDRTTPLGLLHGKRRFNTRWWDLEQLARTADIHDQDEYGCSDEYGMGGGDHGTAESAPSAWFLGPKLGLLMRCSVGTIDQLLYAATRTRHVMLRHLGLAGRVVILDEVHAYDVYMMQFLGEALRWLADAGVPVVLLSATLPPPVRSALASAYLQGALRRRRVEIPEAWNRDDGYPVVRTLTVEEGRPSATACGARGWRESMKVNVEILDEGDDPIGDLSVLLRERLADGGCLLVVRNTVARAQDTYVCLEKEFGARMPVVLLHSRITAGERADRTERVLAHFGPPGEEDAAAERPPMIVVATQLAEQSFDVDADLLITDLAPIDLLLQRIGRLHRHERPRRPGRLSPATVIVTGMRRRDGVPGLPRGSKHVYGSYPLLRAAALVEEVAGNSGTWDIPAQVPELVRRGYSSDPVGPAAWRKEMEAACGEFIEQQARRAKAAAPFVLAGEEDLNRTDLAGLHVMRARGPEDDEDTVQALVRDGEDSVEVILVRRTEEGRFTLDGRWLGTADTRVSDPEVTEALLRSSLRLPTRLTKSAIEELRPLVESGGDPWLCRTRVLDLDQDRRAVVGGRRLRYDRQLGLRDETDKASGTDSAGHAHKSSQKRQS
ncbi:CRISPR-associated helicase Cas3' [Actinoplanes siamensis]|uniref:CRISPR-associated helicase/endonuclease Cas3 n=1 Tax=Actinoplanes siamensis TaxID=1223317 RepID=A0A919N4X5_9ACTN|nr:CRISPR-associated helicase Cas3' [Actinoplanes siamensis]GIF04426.1 CRISPR-associated helicase/endonuclease Cas3 [Actinoplanes siamensis]